MGLRQKIVVAVFPEARYPFWAGKRRQEGTHTFLPSSTILRDTHIFFSWALAVL